MVMISVVTKPVGLKFYNFTFSIEIQGKEWVKNINEYF